MITVEIVEIARLATNAIAHNGKSCQRYNTGLWTNCGSDTFKLLLLLSHAYLVNRAKTSSYIEVIINTTRIATIIWVVNTIVDIAVGTRAVARWADKVWLRRLNVVATRWIEKAKLILVSSNAILKRG